MKLDNELIVSDILELSPVGYWDWDIPSGDEYMSPVFKKMLGYEDREIPNRSESLYKLIAAEDLPRVVKNFEEHINSKGTVPFYNEVRYLHKNGSIVWIISSGKVIGWDDSGNPLRMIGCHIDITECRKNEDKEHSAKEMLRAIAENTPDHIVMQDCNLRYTYVLNPQLGLTADEMIGKTDADFLKPEDAQKLTAIKSDVIATGIPYHLETSLINTSGTLEYFDGNFIPKHDAAGKTDGLIGYFRNVTERKQADRALRESEERLRTILDSTPFPIAVMDAADTVIQYWSKSAIEKFGHTAPTTQEWYRIAYPDPEYRKNVVTRWKSFLEKAKRSGTSTTNTGEYCITCRDGTIRICELYATFIDNNLIVTFNDISERKQAVDALHESEMKFRAIFENSVDAIGVSKAGTHLFVNSAYLQLFGYTSAEELIGTSILNLIAPESRDLITQYIRRRFRRDPVPNFYETCGLKKDGSVFEMDTHISMYEADGEVITVAQLRDISERKQSERVLTETKSNLALAQETASIGSWVFDVTTGAVWWSDEMYKLFGLDPKNGPPSWPDGMEKLYHPDDWKWALPLITESIMNGRWYDIDDRYFRGDGSVGWAQVTGRPITDNDGKFTRFIGTMQDITERKKLEEELQKVQKLESLGLLAGGLAHDFNNLLGGIFGNIDIAVEETCEKERTKCLMKALSTIDRARALTGQLLTFAKGGAPIKKLDPLVPFIEESVKFALAGSNVTCRCDVPDTLWQCEFDRNQIGQILDNIVINAQQAMPEGGTVEVTAENCQLKESTHHSLHSGNYIKIIIRDYGIGMPKELLLKIFDPFFTTKLRGHGLGLATCYSIVKRHGGCIDVDSEPGKGSAFTIYLPASLKNTSAGVPATFVSHHGSGTILVMDDEEVIRDTLSSMLKGMGYRVQSAHDANEAIELFRKEHEGKKRFSLVILDLTIPGGPGGKETIREIRKIDKDIPAVVASGYADDPVMSNPREYGFSSSICKPFRKTELAEVLNLHLRNVM